MSMLAESGPQTSLTLTLNGQPVETRSETLEEFLAEQGYGAQKVATARNGDFVAQRVRAATRLLPGDKIEVVSARQGG